MTKSLVGAVALIGAAFAVPAHADTLASWNGVNLSTNNNNVSALSFAAQTSDLYIQLSLTPQAGTTISENDFAVLWLDKVATGDHTSVPNIGLKANIVGTPGDYMVRGNSTNNYIGAFTNDQAAIGTTVTLWAHLYKSGNSTTYNTFDLWSNPSASTWNEVLASTVEARSTLNSGLTSISSAGFRVATLSGSDAILVNSAAISNSVAVVPEPETYAMLLTGLGLMGAIARRRKSAQA